MVTMRILVEKSNIEPTSGAITPFIFGVMVPVVIGLSVALHTVTTLLAYMLLGFLIMAKISISMEEWKYFIHEWQGVFKTTWNGADKIEGIKENILSKNVKPIMLLLYIISFVLVFIYFDRTMMGSWVVAPLFFGGVFAMILKSTGFVGDEWTWTLSGTLFALGAIILLV